MRSPQSLGDKGQHAVNMEQINEKKSSIYMLKVLEHVEHNTTQALSLCSEFFIPERSKMYFVRLYVSVHIWIKSNDFKVSKFQQQKKTSFFFLPTCACKYIYSFFL